MVWVCPWRLLDELFTSRTQDTIELESAGEFRVEVLRMAMGWS